MERKGIQTVKLIFNFDWVWNPFIKLPTSALNAACMTAHKNYVPFYIFEKKYHYFWKYLSFFYPMVMTRRIRININHRKTILRGIHTDQVYSYKNMWLKTQFSTSGDWQVNQVHWWFMPVKMYWLVKFTSENILFKDKSVLSLPPGMMIHQSVELGQCSPRRSIATSFLDW